MSKDMILIDIDATTINAQHVHSDFLDPANVALFAKPLRAVFEETPA